MYVFNDWLFEKACDFTGITPHKLSQMLGRNHSYISDLKRSKMGVRMSELIAICNIVRIPVGYFFCRKSDLGTYTEYTGEYMSATLRVDAIADLFAGQEKSSTHLSCRAVKRTLNKNVKTGKARDVWYMNGRSTITAKELVHVCNTLHVDINRFVDDPLNLLPSLYTDADYRMTCERIAQAEAEATGPLNKTKPGKRELQSMLIGELEKRIAHLEAQNRKLQAENRKLKNGTFIGIAADEQDYGTTK